MSIIRDFKDIINSPGGLFDVSEPEMEKNIGRKMTFKPRVQKGSRSQETFTVVCVQHLYDGSLAYRVCQHEGDFGMPVSPEDIIWLD